MKKKWTMFACAAMAAVMGSALFVSCGGSKNYAENNEKFYIGASGPLTGGAAVYGKAVQNGAQLAVEEINAAGGLDGKQFEFVMMDDSNDDTRVNSNYASLYEKGMQVSLGCVTTKPCLAFKQLAEEDNLFFLTPSATGDDVIGGGNAYQMCFSDSGQGTAAAEYVRENVTESTIGIFYKSDDPYSNGIYQNFISALGKNSNFTFVTTSFTDDTNADFSSQINRLKDCKFIFMPIYTEPASLFMMQAKGVISDDATYFGCDGFDGIESAFTEANPISAIPQEISYLSHFDATAESGTAKEFIDSYTAKYGKDTLNQFGVAAYDCVYAIYEAMETAISGGEEIPVNISASDLCDILKETFQKEDFTFDGVTGTGIYWSEDGTVNKVPVKYIVKEKSSAA